MIFVTGNPIFVAFFEGEEARITSILESALDVGILTGPALGSLLFSLGGYQFSVYSCGWCRSCVFTCMQDVDDTKKYENELYLIGKQQGAHCRRKNISFVWFWYKQFKRKQLYFNLCSVKALFTKFSIVFLCLSTLMIALGSGCITVTLAPFLLEQFDIGSKQSGFYFLCFGATYTGGAFIVGFLGDKWNYFHQPVNFLPLGSLSYLCLGSMHFIPWIKS